MLRTLLTSTIILTSSLSTWAQAMFFDSAKVEGDTEKPQSLGAKLNSVISGTYVPEDEEEMAADTVIYASVADSLLACYEPPLQLMSLAPLPEIMYLPAIFSYYEAPDTTSIFTPDYSGVESLRWIEDLQASYARYNRSLHDLASYSPWAMRYNRRLLPDPPKDFVVSEAKPEDFRLNVSSEATNVSNATTLIAEEVNKKHWIKDFRTSLQFMQAYVSPNWYQGGNNNLNALFSTYYNVKLNPAFHPTLLFETTFQYKLGLNSAPDDKLHDYNISDDLFQVNSELGIKAIRKWYYSLTGQFKTQFFNSYKSNSNDLRSAFLSPAELNLSVGMTYSTTNKKKTIAFDANISPLSDNMMICINRKMDETAYGISKGHKTVHQIGSKLESKLNWQICYNINLRSRLFAFTDYDRAYVDWENTLTFEINRYITTQLYVHMRYDTHTPQIENEHWHKLQIKEILSLGFAYRFSSL